MTKIEELTLAILDKGGMVYKTGTEKPGETFFVDEKDRRIWVEDDFCYRNHFVDGRCVHRESIELIYQIYHDPSLTTDYEIAEDWVYYAVKDCLEHPESWSLHIGD